MYILLFFGNYYRCLFELLKEKGVVKISMNVIASILDYLADHFDTLHILFKHTDFFHFRRVLGEGNSSAFDYYEEQYGHKLENYQFDWTTIKN